MLTKSTALKSINILIIALLLATIFGCGGDGTNRKSSGKQLQDASSEVAATYKARCLNCHGSELQGRVGANTNLMQIGSRMSKEQIAMQINEGKGVMPAFKDMLTQEEIEGLADWLAGKQ